MKISTRLIQAINDEIGLELFAHAQYVVMAAYFENRSLDKLAAFFYDQAEEEKEHGLKLVRYLTDRGATVNIPALPQPRSDFVSAEDVMKSFVSQEEHVTEQFYRMCEIALEDKDFISYNFLQWFVEEQMEEMSISNKLLDLVRMAGESNVLMVEMLVSDLEAPALPATDS